MCYSQIGCQSSSVRWLLVVGKYGSGRVLCGRLPVAWGLEASGRLPSSWAQAADKSCRNAAEVYGGSEAALCSINALERSRAEVSRCVRQRVGLSTEGKGRCTLRMAMVP